MLDNDAGWPRGSGPVALRLGQYELVRRIGRGGMAEVWMARKAAVGGATKSVAIKRLTGPRAEDPNYLRLFMDEARLSMLLSHSNIVQVFDVGQADGECYLVMEWVDGLNLSQMGYSLRECGLVLPLHVVAYIIGETLRALGYAHSLTHEGKPLGIVHRDVSPQNVIVSVSGEVKLADFGVASVARNETSGTCVKGKLRYMPAEQLAGQSRSPKVDLYAVGALLHELLEGRKFWSDVEDDVELYARISQRTLPVLDHPAVPEPLDRLRRALLEPDPERRLGNADDALAMLQRWSGYRNASVELARSCRLFLGVQAPRSGVFREFPEPQRPHASSQIATVAQAKFDEPVTISTMTADRPAPARWIRASTAAALVFGTIGIAALVWRGIMHQSRVSEGPRSEVLPAATVVRSMKPPDLRDTTDAAAMTIAVANPSVGGTRQSARAQLGEGAAAARSASAASDNSRSGRAVPRQRTGAGGQPNDAATGTDVASQRGASLAAPAVAAKARRGKSLANGAASAQGKGEPVPVHLRLRGVRLAYVRFDAGPEHILQPTAEAKLAPGRHELSWRHGSHEPWTEAAPVVIESGREYVLRVTDAGPVLELQR